MCIVSDSLGHMNMVKISAKIASFYHGRLHQQSIFKQYGFYWPTMNYRETINTNIVHRTQIRN